MEGTGSSVNDDQVPRTRIRFTLCRARTLHKYLKIKSDWIAEISVDGGQICRAETVAKYDPEWAYSVEFNVTNISVVKISIYQRTKLPWVNEEFMGDVSIPLQNLYVEITTGSKPVEHFFELQRPTNNRSYSPSVDVKISPANEQSGLQSSSPSNDRAVTEKDNDIIAVTRNVMKRLDFKGFDKFVLLKDYLDLAVRLGESLSEIHPFAKLAWTAFTAIPSALLSQLEQDQEVEELWTNAVDMLDFLKAADVMVDEQLSPIIATMLKQFYDCSTFIREYCGIGFLRRTLKSRLTTQKTKIKEFSDSFRMLRQRFNERSNLTTWKLVNEGTLQLGSLVQTINNIDRQRLLENLPSAMVPNVRWDLGHVCLPRTRLVLIDDILEWSNGVDQPNIYWLHGVAGAGKSTVSNTVAQIFESLERLGASFRFSREVALRNEPGNLIGNLTYQLARFNTQLRERILAAIDTYGDMNGLPISNQLRILFVEILSTVQFAGPLMIVIDALDEAGDEQAREALLQAITNEAHRIPKYVRIFITSRDEADIRGHLLHISISKSIDNALNTNADIQAYIEHRMVQIRLRYPGLPSGWPELAARIELVSRAHGLFQWAAVVCRYIQNFDPVQRLAEILSQAPIEPRLAEKALDQLYLDILCRVCSHIPSAAFRHVFGTILLVRTPITRSTLDSLLGLGQPIVGRPIPYQMSSSESIVILMGSLLKVEQESGAGEYIRILHPSLLDFFLDNQRCTDSRFFIQRAAQHGMIATRCLNVMNTMLKRDICSISNPLLPNTSIPPEQVQKAIPPHLSYACRYWADHLWEVPTDVDEFATEARLFLFEHLLHWLEAMSLFGMINTTSSMLRKVRKWFQATEDNNAVLELLDDAVNFVQRFQDPITESAAQIYISALPFVPSETLFSRTFSRRYHDIPKMVCGIPKTWHAFRSSSNISSYRTSPISPDGTRFLAYNDESGVLQIRDFTTTEIISTLTSHNRVTYARFSDNSAFLMTAGSDATIRVWDAETGIAIGKPCGPFEIGYGWSVRPGIITTSPDGSRVAATFGRDVLQVWDVFSGASLASFYNNDRSDISPCFSPDGRTLLTGWKYSILVIDTVTWTLKQDFNFPDFAGDVEFSSDATKMAYSREGTTKLICAQTGNVILTLTPSETPSIGSAFSPNSRFFVSLEDGILTLWDLSENDPVPTTLNIRDIRNIVWSSRSRLAFTTQGLLYIVNPAVGLSSLFSFPTCNIVALSWENKHDHIVAIADDKSVLFWDDGSGLQTLGYIAGERQPSSVAISANLSFLITTNFLKIDVWEIGLLSRHPSGTSWPENGLSFKRYRPRVAFDPNTMKVATSHADGRITVRNGLESPKVLEGPTQKIKSLVLSHDGVYLASACSDCTILIWDTRTYSRLSLPHPKVVKRIAFFSGSEKIATCSTDRSIRIWSVVTGEQLSAAPFAFAPFMANSFTITADNKWIVGASKYGTLYFVDAVTGTVHDLLDGRGGMPWDNAPYISVLFSPDRWTVRTLSSQTQTELWDATPVTPATLLTTEQNLPTSTIISAIFSPDYKRFFYAHMRHSISIHDHSTGASRSVGDCLSEIVSMQFSFDGEYLATLSREGRIRIWRAALGSLVTESQELFVTGVNTFNFSLDATKVAVTSAKRVYVWDAMSGETLWTVEERYESVYFSRDGTYLVCMHRMYGTWYIIYQTESGEEIHRLQVRSMPNLSEHHIPPDAEHNLSEITLYQPPDYSKRDRKASTQDKLRSAVASTVLKFSIMDSQTLTQTSVLSHDGTRISLSSPTFSLDGTLIGIVCKGSIIIWDVMSGEKIGIATVPGQSQGTTFNMYEEHTYDPSELSIDSFSFVGKQSPMIAAITRQNLRNYKRGGSGSSVKITLCLWDRTGNVINEDGMSSVRLWDPVFFPDGSRLLMHRGSRYREAEIWDTLHSVSTKALELVNQSHERFDPSNVAFTTDETRFAHVGQRGVVSVYDLENGVILHHGLRSYHQSIQSISFAPHCPTKLVLLSEDRTFLIWDLEKPPSTNNPVINFPAHMQAVHDFPHRPWFEGTGGQKLIWVPGDDRDCHAAISPGYVVFGPSETDDDGPLVVDITDYLQVPAVREAWREGGVQFSYTRYFQRAPTDATVARVIADFYYRDSLPIP